MLCHQAELSSAPYDTCVGCDVARGDTADGIHAEGLLHKLHTRREREAALDGRVNDDAFGNERFVHEGFDVGEVSVWVR